MLTKYDLADQRKDEACHTNNVDVHTALVGNSALKRQLGKPGFRWEGNIKMFLQEIALTSV
jgi:hypothetical protein